MTDLELGPETQRPVAGRAVASSAMQDDVLRALEQRVLWLSTAMIHHANRVRPNSSGVKVGGHQASSASMVTLMTSLWFEQLTGEDRVSVKPHASPVLHALNYLLGELDESYLSRLREFGGLQSYPSRIKDPDPVDYSTGSVGIGATATLWGAIARRYVGGGTGRQYALVGDAELDEGAVWEAVLDPMVEELGEVVWVVDVNRQSLDRVVPKLSVCRLEAMFRAAGWQVLTAKYGSRLQQLFGQPGGDALRARIDEMSNHEYQRLLRCSRADLRARLSATASSEPTLSRLINGLDDDHLYDGIRDLGGHDFAELRKVWHSLDDTRPTVVFAYTIKGYRLPTQGHPQNHSSLLTHEQMPDLAASLDADHQRPWDRFVEDSPEERACRAVARKLIRPPARISEPPVVPLDLARTPSGTTATQTVLGRTLVELTRSAPEVAKRVVTAAPDVSSSTNLGGWVNKVGVWTPGERQNWFGDDPDTLLHWNESPLGQHIELGIAETNLVGLLGELGATWSRWGEPLLPIGVLYDPFVTRALEPWSFGIYAGGRSILVGTPSGVTLAPEGGAHQSTLTPSIGLEMPGCVSYEPAFALDAEWCLLEALAGLGRPDGSSYYLRLSTRVIDQSLAVVPEDPAARELRRRCVTAGGYRLKITGPSPALTVAAMGAVLPQALAAADRLTVLGVPTDVVCVTSPGLLFTAMQSQQGNGDLSSWIIDQVFPRTRVTPLLTVLDGHPHALSFLAGIRGVPHLALGVREFGQSGSLEDVYAHYELDEDAIVRAALTLRSMV